MGWWRWCVLCKCLSGHDELIEDCWPGNECRFKQVLFKQGPSPAELTGSGLMGWWLATEHTGKLMHAKRASVGFVCVATQRGRKRTVLYMLLTFFAFWNTERIKQNRLWHIHNSAWFIENKRTYVFPCVSLLMTDGHWVCCAFYILSDIEIHKSLAWHFSKYNTRELWFFSLQDPEVMGEYYLSSGVTQTLRVVSPMMLQR